VSTVRLGTLVAAHGRHYEVELQDGTRTTGYPKAKKSVYVCGDRVELSGDGQILRHAERSSLLYRSDAYRQKLIAANVTQLVLVVATEPGFSELLLSRALVAAEHEGIRPLIVLNKCDLTNGLPAARTQLALFGALGYRIVELSAHKDVSTLRPLLIGEISVLVGQSGMGKSTLTNALIPEAEAATREISTALDSGKHTTTYARLYRTDDGITLIDSPGLQEFGLAHMTLGEIEHGFVEFRPFLGQCRFRDCRHDAEPGCAVKNGIAAGTVNAKRLEHFHQLVSEIPDGPH
jgi:ribosome biogenesis GTPase